MKIIQNVLNFIGAILIVILMYLILCLYSVWYCLVWFLTRLLFFTEWGSKTRVKNEGMLAVFWFLAGEVVKDLCR